MSCRPAANQQNGFLSSLTESDFALLRPHLRQVRLDHRQVLFHEQGRMDQIYFPTSGAISLVVALSNGELIEAAMVGRDGVAGAPAALGLQRSLNRALVQVQGDGFAVDANHARVAAEGSPTLRAKFYRYDQSILLQAQQSAACNATHQTEERFCRWILRARDATGGDRLELTQEFIAEMLGVRRTSVTLAARHFQAIGLIKYRRGTIDIVDLEGLQESSCECYEAIKTQEQHLFGLSH